MNKSRAIYVFRGVTNLSKALGVTRTTIYNWKEKLPQGTEDRINGAALRLGLDMEMRIPHWAVPDDYRND